MPKKGEGRTWAYKVERDCKGGNSSKWHWERRNNLGITSWCGGGRYSQFLVLCNELRILGLGTHT